jgi:hypothetical protein
MRVLDDYACEKCGLVEEHFVQRGTQTLKCLSCSGVATRVRSVPNFMLPGNGQGFPTADDKWVAKREQKRQEELKRDA